MDKLVNNDNLASMTTPDQLECDSAWHIRDAAMLEAIDNCKNPEDWDAAAVAILTHAIEIITKKEITLCYKQNSTTSNN
jgi:hypothetical protein